MPGTPRTRTGEQGTVPADSRTKALGRDLRAEGGETAQGTGEGKRQEAQEETSPV